MLTFWLKKKKFIKICNQSLLKNNCHLLSLLAAGSERTPETLRSAIIRATAKTIFFKNAILSAEISSEKLLLI